MIIDSVLLSLQQILCVGPKLPRVFLVVSDGVILDQFAVWVLPAIDQLFMVLQRHLQGGLGALLIILWAQPEDGVKK